MCLKADTALGQNCLVQSLVEDVKRRLASCSSHISQHTLNNILDLFAKKMITSGHTMAVARKITISGIKGHTSKINHCQKTGTHFNRSASDSTASRRHKKMSSKSSWFKPKHGEQCDETNESMSTFKFELAVPLIPFSYPSCFQKHKFQV